jgi:hypothetical protein
MNANRCGFGPQRFFLQKDGRCFLKEQISARKSELFDEYSFPIFDFGAIIHLFMKFYYEGEGEKTRGKNSP